MVSSDKTGKKGVSKARITIFLFSASLAVRLLFFIPVCLNNVQPVHDEWAYFKLSMAYEKTIGEMLDGNIPPPLHYLASTRGDAKRPPLYPLLISAGLLIFGDKVCVARLVVLLFSAMTTPLVFFFSVRFVNRKSALAAALIHIFYPSFIAYSHYLWSETVCVFFLLLSLCFAVDVIRSETSRARYGHAILSGALLGVSGLVRAAIAPYMVFLPLWMFFRLKRSRAALSAAVFGSCAVVLLPWQVTLSLFEKRVVPMSNNSEFNLYLGNNPWVPEGLGSSWGHGKSRYFVEESIREYMDEHSVSRETAAGRLAEREIKSDYGKFIVRSLYRLRMLWSADFFIMRHVLQLVYPPMPAGSVIAIWITVVVGYILFMLFTARGMLFNGPGFRNLSLLLTVFITGMVPPVLTIAVSRFHFMLLALALPAAGYGVTTIPQKMSNVKRALLSLVGVFLLYIVFSTMPLVVSNYLQPSSYYAGLINSVDAVLGSKTECADCISFKRGETAGFEQVEVYAVTEGYFFHDYGRKMIRVWFPEPDNEAEFTLRSYNQGSRPVLFIRAGGRQDTIIPVEPSGWREWKFTGIPGLKYMWQGGFCQEARREG